MIVLAGACLFAVSAIIAPRRGAVARLTDHVVFRRRLREQVVWRSIYEALESRRTGPRTVEVEELCRRTSLPLAQIEPALRQAQHNGLLAAQSSGAVMPTTAGLNRAARVTRCYRLWERFLIEYPESTGTFARLDVELADAVLPRAIIEELEESLHNARRLPVVPGQERTQ
jgi:Mn-dependent DtxR family transcriptional regulator